MAVFSQHCSHCHCLHCIAIIRENDSSILQSFTLLSSVLSLTILVFFRPSSHRQLHRIIRSLFLPWVSGPNFFLTGWKVSCSGSFFILLMTSSGSSRSALMMSSTFSFGRSSSCFSSSAISSSSLQIQKNIHEKVFFYIPIPLTL